MKERLLRFRDELLKKIRKFKMNRKVQIGILFLILLSCYAGGGVGKFLNPGRYPRGMDPFSCIAAAFTSRAGFTMSILIILLLLGFALYLKFSGGMRSLDDERGFRFSTRGTYGTACILKEESDYDDFLDVVDDPEETKGTILGKTDNGERIVAIPENSDYNRNIAVCGSQGTSKSIAIVRNMIIQSVIRGESIFVTDPKAELYEDTAYYLSKNGYKVVQWNLVNRWNSNGWDILAEVQGSEDELEYVDILCHTIIANTMDPEHSDPFYDNLEEVLLKSLVLFVLNENPREKQTLGDVYQMIMNYDTDQLDLLFSKLRNDHPARGPYNLLSSAQKLKGNAIIGLGGRMKVFQTPVVQQMTGFPEIDIESIAKEKTAVFCIFSDTNNTYRVLNALFVSMMMIKLFAFADKQLSHKCPVGVSLILDEFPALGNLGDLKQFEATARSRGIGMALLFQNIPQLMDRYPGKEWEELLGGCDFTIFLGGNDMTTCDYFSRLSGNGTVTVETERKNLKTFRMTDFTPDVAQSKGDGKRPPYLEDEIRRMDDNDMLVWVRSKNVVKLKKFKYYEHEESLRFRQIKAMESIPQWRISDGIDIKTGQPAESFEQLLNRAENDDSRLVVKDSERWGMQRTELIKKMRRSRSLYKLKGQYPNGQPFFDARGHLLKSQSDDHSDNPRKEQPIIENMLNDQGSACGPDLKTESPVQESSVVPDIIKDEVPEVSGHLPDIKIPKPEKDPKPEEEPAHPDNLGEEEELEWSDSSQVDDLLDSIFENGEKK